MKMLKIGEFDDDSFKKRIYRIVLLLCFIFFVLFKWKEGVVFGVFGLEEREFFVDFWILVFFNW